ncbi:MAG: hypothetical protein Q7U38_17385 [Methylobacter sp.]|nr:hypothetical protein [Methylobacter sp.]MDP2100717.1 hypothetical protein [Methylobacter sp.]MDP2427817.1 hypothetical protein [Methylobacter sp.]MDP3055026.1 hypothetical protein [Methylobacter sp.]MDP3363849.1 hypothetical protein [Methylobacter sp.]
MQKKNISKYPFIIGVAMLANAAASAAPPANQAPEPVYRQAEAEKKHIAMVGTQGLDTVLDIPLRLGGLIATVIGAGLFIGTSPITGLMTALHPHDAIKQAADYLVGRPAHYTFVRPSGDINYVTRPYDEH